MTPNKTIIVFSFILTAVLVLCLMGCQRPDVSGSDRGRDSAAQNELMAADDEMQPCTIEEPCEEASAAVEAIPPDDPRLEDAYVIDARDSKSFESWHYSGARNVVYDILDPVSPEVVQKLQAINAPIYVVYGDGDLPDSGEELARDLAGQGVENVYYVEGGVAVLRGSKGVASQD